MPPEIDIQELKNLENSKRGLDILNRGKSNLKLVNLEVRITGF